MAFPAVLSRGVLAATVLASGCFYYYPKEVPKLNGALVVEGQPIDVETTSEARWEECTDYQLQHNECEVHHAKAMHPYTLYIATTRYGGRDLTQAEFFELAMADYPDRIRGIQNAASTCRISAVPSAIAVLAAVAAIGVPLFFSTSFNDDQKTTIFVAGAATTLAASLLSYPIGGYACVRASGLAGNLLTEHKATTWEARDGAFTQLHELADAFNAKRGTGAPPSHEPAAEPEAEPGPAAARPDEPAPDRAPEAPTDGLTATLRAAGRFSVFLRLVDASDYKHVLDRAGKHTVLAPTDDAFSAFPAKEVDKLLSDPKALNEFVGGHIVKGRFESTALLRGAHGVDTEARTHLTITPAKGELRVGKQVLSVPELAASNGVVYAIEHLL